MRAYLEISPGPMGPSVRTTVPGVSPRSHSRVDTLKSSPRSDQGSGSRRGAASVGCAQRAPACYLLLTTETRPLTLGCHVRLCQQAGTL